VRKLLVAILIAALVVGLVARGRHRDPTHGGPPPRAVPVAVAVDNGAAHATAGPVDHVKRLASPEERKQLEKRIADARAARANAGTRSSTSAPQLPATAAGGIESLPTKTLDALKAAIPYLSECFGSDSPKNPIVQMTLEGDPDVGTLIDPGQMTDETGGSISGPLADCLQSTLQSLELPPLAEGSSVRLQYSFRL